MRFDYTHPFCLISNKNSGSGATGTGIFPAGFRDHSHGFAWSLPQALFPFVRTCACMIHTRADNSLCFAVAR